MKTDCTYRMGLCFQQLGDQRKAELCYRRHINLLSMGIEGTYSIEDAMERIRRLHGDAANHGAAETEIRKALHSTLEAIRLKSAKGRRSAFPKLDLGDLASGRVAAVKAP